MNDYIKIAYTKIFSKSATIINILLKFQKVYFICRKNFFPSTL